MNIRQHLGRVKYGVVFAAIVSMSLIERPASADEQSSAAPATISQADLQKLIQHVNQQDEEIRELKQQVQSQSKSAPPPATDTVAKQLQHQESEIQQVKSEVAASAAQQSEQTFPSLQFHGFGDIDYHVSNQK